MGRHDRLKRQASIGGALGQDAVPDPDQLDRPRAVDRLDQCAGREAGPDGD